MKVAVIGYGKQGQSAAEYWHNLGHEVTICDKNTDIETPAWLKTKLGPDHLNNLDQFDLIVRSPIVHPDQIVKANTPEIYQKVTTTTNEFFRVCPTKNIIGVTGTKGKGTTSTLISKTLQSAGYTVHLGGNIGIDPLLMLNDNIKPEDWVVLELANFQLIDFKYAPKIGVCLTVMQEHTDWHTSLDEYYGSKSKLFSQQSADDIAVYYAKNDTSVQIAGVSGGKKIPYMQEPGAAVENDSVMIQGNKIIDIKDIKLLGKHNWQNICAAVTACWQITQDVNVIKSAISNFKGLPHRIEFVKNIDGVDVYNDSFSTGQTSTIAALKAMTKPTTLILGGFDRNIPQDPLLGTIKSGETNLKNIVLIGQSTEMLKGKLEEIGYHSYTIEKSKDINEIAKTALNSSESDEAVLFSPGFASFDMFKNFEDRGNKFKQAINDI